MSFVLYKSVVVLSKVALHELLSTVLGPHNSSVSLIITNSRYSSKHLATLAQCTFASIVVALFHTLEHCSHIAWLISPSSANPEVNHSQVLSAPQKKATSKSQSPGRDLEMRETWYSRSGQSHIPPPSAPVCGEASVASSKSGFLIIAWQCFLTSSWNSPSLRAF